MAASPDSGADRLMCGSSGGSPKISENRGRIFSADPSIRIIRIDGDCAVAIGHEIAMRRRAPGLAASEFRHERIVRVAHNRERIHCGKDHGGDMTSRDALA
jgi:hypothetical protein